MLRFRIFLMMILFSSLVNAQNYESIFGIDSTKWSYYTEWMGADYWSTINFTVDTDTVINENSYKILNSEQEGSGLLRFGYLREDTTEGKVWFRPVDLKKEFLYMDFNLNIADTFTWNTPKGICDSKVVQDIIIDNGKKKIIFERGYGSFIEGVGSTFAFYIHGRFCSNSSIFLCSHKDGVLCYDNPEYDTCFIPFYVNLFHTNLDVKNIKIYPNPAKTTLSVEFDTESKEKKNISVFNIYGQIILSKLTDLNKISINVSEFEKRNIFYKDKQS